MIPEMSSMSSDPAAASRTAAFTGHRTYCGQADALLGRLLEERAKGGTMEAIRKLSGLRPDTVLLVDQAGAEHPTPIGRVQPGDLIAVRPGTLPCGV